VVLIIGGVADVFAIWHRLAPPEQQAAVERTHQLGIQAEAIAGVLAPQARCTFDGACGVCS
jgi:hypothetical protein